MKNLKTFKEFVNESKTITITEGIEEQIKKEVISKLSDFFGCAPGNLSKFNFDGKDNIKELTKALRSTSDEGTAQYYRVAIQMAKRDLGIHESIEFLTERKELKLNTWEESPGVINRFRLGSEVIGLRSVLNLSSEKWTRGCSAFSPNEIGFENATDRKEAAQWIEKAFKSGKLKIEEYTLN